MLNSLGGILSLFRHRRLGIRRVLEFGEITNSGDANVLDRWNMRSDVFAKISNMTRLAEIISLYGGYTYKEIIEDIAEKSSIINWMVANKIIDVDSSGYLVGKYYKNKEDILKLVKDNVAFSPEMLK